MADIAICRRKKKVHLSIYRNGFQILKPDLHLSLCFCHSNLKTIYIFEEYKFISMSSSFSPPLLLLLKTDKNIFGLKIRETFRGGGFAIMQTNSYSYFYLLSSPPLCIKTYFIDMIECHDSRKLSSRLFDIQKKNKFRCHANFASLSWFSYKFINRTHQTHYLVMLSLSVLKFRLNGLSFLCLDELK